MKFVPTNRIEDPKPEEKKQRKNFGYTLMGMGDLLDDEGYPIVMTERVHDDNRVYAILEKRKTGNYYFIRFHNIQNVPVDPRDETQASMIGKASQGRDLFEFRPCNADQFNNYKEFLKTRDQNYLRQSRRI